LPGRQFPIAPHGRLFWKLPGFRGTLFTGERDTLITEGSGGRIIEVTADHRLVWEYISPYWGKHFKMNMIYRAYRLPYEWVPQLDAPRETPIAPIDVTTFRVPGAVPPGAQTEVTISGTRPYQASSTLCVLSDTDAEA